jgi:hypothetical protein
VRQQGEELVLLAHGGVRGFARAPLLLERRRQLAAVRGADRRAGRAAWPSLRPISHANSALASSTSSSSAARGPRSASGCPRPVTARATVATIAMGTVPASQSITSSLRTRGIMALPRKNYSRRDPLPACHRQATPRRIRPTSRSRPP